MALLCHVITQEHAIKGPCHVTLWMGALMLTHHPAKFGGHGHCDGRDTKLLEFEEQDLTCLFKSVITVYV